MNRLKSKPVALVCVMSLLIAGGTFALEPEFGAPLSPAGEPDPAAATMLAEMQQIRTQLQTLSAQLSDLQQQAFEAQQVMDAFAEFEARLRGKMIELEPAVAGDIEEAEGLLEELRTVEDFDALPPEEAMVFQEKFARFQETVQRLQPIEQQASQDPEIRTAQEGLENKVLDAMTEINPDARDLLRQQEELMDRYMQLEGQQVAP